MIYRIVLIVLLANTSLLAQVSSRDNVETAKTSESWRTPIVKGGYPVKNFPKAKISGEKPIARDIGGKHGLTLEEFNRIMDQKIEEFHRRIQREIKEDQRLARLMQKPQYADPSYFGHKRKPRKRAPGKRKLCKECGIVH